jgi:hypothetical protein
MWDLSPDGRRFMMIKEVQLTNKAVPEGRRKINLFDLK